jgi:hypothetical protein
MSDSSRQLQRSFPELPNELKTQVFGYVTDLRTLRNSCLASKLLQKVAEPRLYRKVITGTPTHFATSYAKNTQTIREALLMLLRRPELGRYVRKVVCNRHSDSEHVPRGRPEEDALLFPVAEQANIWRTTDWMHQPETDFIPLYLGLILTQVPRLRELRYVAEYDETGSVAAMVNLAAQSLTKLTNLQIEHWDTEMGFSMSDFGPLLRLPSLRYFKGIYVSKAQLEYQDWETGEWIGRVDFPSNSLAVEHFVFRGSALGPWCITTLFAACKAVKTFDYVAGGANRGYAQFEPHELMKVLRRHEATLERLLLTDLCDACYDITGMERGTQYALGSLASFSNLKILSCEQAMLIGIGTCDVCRWDNESENCTHEHDRMSCK